MISAGRGVTRVVLSGYYGFGNTGDELVLLAIIEQLRQVDPSVDITVLSNDPQGTARDHGVRAVPRMNPLAVASALRGSDLLISGGGSLLQDVTSGRTVPYYLGIISMAQALGTPVFLYAQGVGPLLRQRSRDLVRKVVSKVAGITVRDAESAALLAEVGVTGPAITVTADPVFGLRAEPGAGDALPAGLTGGPRFGLAIRPWPARPGWKSEIAGAARRCADELGARLVWLAFHPPGDLELARELSGLAGDAHGVVVDCRSPREMLNLVSQLDLVIGMRLHALIAAAVSGRPFVGLSYDPKVESLLGHFGLDRAPRVDEVTAEELFGEIKRVWQAKDSFIKTGAPVVEALRAQALETAQQALAVSRRRGGRGGNN